MKRKHQKEKMDEALKALREAVREVVKENKRLGLPLVIWKDGKVVKIPAKKLK